MQNILLQRYFFIAMAGICVLPLSVSARPVDLSEIEVDQLLNNKDGAYIYCDKQHSKMAEVMARVSRLDNDAHSPVKEFNEHMQQGFIIGRKEAVMDALDCAQVIIDAASLQGALQQIRLDLVSVQNAVVTGE